jgi:hypothetical protein
VNGEGGAPAEGVGADQLAGFSGSRAGEGFGAELCRGSRADARYRRRGRRRPRGGAVCAEEKAEENASRGEGARRRGH